MSTTPTSTLKVLIGLPDLTTRIKKEAMAAHLRSRDVEFWFGKGMNIGFPT